MKTKLNNPTFVPISFEDMPVDTYLDSIVAHIKKQVPLPLGATYHVSKCWLNPATYEKYEDRLRKHLKLLKIADSSASWIILDMGFAYDSHNSFNIPDDTIAIEEDCFVYSDKEAN